MTEKDFEKCIKAINHGKKDGLHQIYEEYAPYIYGIVRSVLQNREDAEDVTSDFFIKLWEKSDSYKPGNGHKGWMATIARNLAIDKIRKYRKEEPVDFSASGDEEETQNQIGKAAMNAAADANVEAQVISDISIKEALETLNEKEKNVIHMKIMGEMTFQEIADLLGEPLGTITWRYREAIKKLRRCGYEESGNRI